MGLCQEVWIPWKPSFLAAYRAFVDALGRRYDGNSTIAYVRMGTGRTGEDAYPYRCTGHPYPAAVCQSAGTVGWTSTRWYKFIGQVLHMYAGAFTKTRLSLDLLLAGEFYNPSRLPRAQTAKVIATLLGYARQHHMMIGYNGLNDESLLPGQPTYVRNDIQILAAARRAREPIELETFAPPTNLEMSNVSAIATTIRQVDPDYVNFFGEFWADRAYFQNRRSSEAAQGSWEFAKAYQRQWQLTKSWYASWASLLDSFSTVGET